MRQRLSLLTLLCSLLRSFRTLLSARLLGPCCSYTEAKLDIYPPAITSQYMYVSVHTHTNLNSVGASSFFILLQAQTQMMTFSDVYSPSVLLDVSCKNFMYMSHTHTHVQIQSKVKIVIHVKPAKMFYVQDLSLLDTCKCTRIFACGISMISSSQPPKKLFKVPLQKSSFLP